MNKKRFNYLFEKYKQDSLSLEEYRELVDMLRESGSEHSLDRLLTRYWKETSHSISGTDVQSNISPQHSASLSAGSLRQSLQPPKEVQRRRKRLHVRRSSEKLRNEEGNDSLSTENLRQRLRPPKEAQRRRQSQQLNDSTSQRLYWGIAATLLLLVGLFFYLQGSTDLLGQKEVVYKTGFGERLEVDLDDGSHVTLNANSELRWAEDWKNSKDRQVILKGEAFFEVKKQHGIPFTVNTNDVAVEVLGTSFNVETREAKTEVYLDEGKVNLRLKEELPDHKESEEQHIIMKPGDQVRYSAREKKIVKTEGQNMITAAAWKNNVLNFKNMEFHDVLELLRDIYGQSFECTDGDLLTKPMYLGVPYSDWDAVRQALELSLNIQFEKVTSNRYVVKRVKK